MTIVDGADIRFYPFRIHRASCIVFKTAYLLLDRILHTQGYNAFHRRPLINSSATRCETPIICRTG
ncbi:hypothetical protein M378DRAFT_157822 [Amanita muscaria Koide BX008]|uniref:Uncharacterized protein n=1 Tax=Amanita muscaria (strain Koide BX008) TaxID=946122 RepID=A0A0C2XH11_AMAMK|nr:hypothetical protein M378DRAFT_157822 [Amanita muscaria Koide BX008]